MPNRLIVILSTLMLAACSEPVPQQDAAARNADRRALLAEAEVAVALANDTPASSGSDMLPTESAQSTTACPDTERPTAPPAEHTLRLTVLDTKTHLPVEGIVVDVADREPRRTRSDASGIALIDSRGLPPMGDIEIHCPGIEQGPMLPRRTPAPPQPYRLTAGRADLLVHVDLARCRIPDVVSRKLRMRGMYVPGFESSQFYPCDGLPAESDDFEFAPHSAWVEFTPEAEDDMAFGAWRERAFGDGVLYAEWSGVLSGPGSYGHWGMSLYEMRVETVHDTGMSQPSDCRAPGFEARGRL